MRRLCGAGSYRLSTLQLLDFYSERSTKRQMNSEKLVLSDKDIMRFWRKVSLSSPSERYPGIGKCWIWEGAKTKEGYGKFTHSGKSHGAQRMSFEIHERKLKQGEYACHKCDNPSCVRPDHIFPADQKGNLEDMTRKGRRVNFIKLNPHLAARGSKVANSKITESDVIEIKRMRAEGMKQIEIGRIFGIQQITVSNILTGKTWRHVQ